MEEGSSQILGEEIITGQDPEPPIREKHPLWTVVGPVSTDAEEAMKLGNIVYVPPVTHTPALSPQAINTLLL